jgi:hypothetical protein
VWRDLYEAAERTIKGSVETLAERRQKALDSFKAYGLTTAMVFKVLGVSGVSEITLDLVGIMRGILTALKDGETTVESLMSDAVGVDSGVTEKNKERIAEIKARYSTAKPAATSQSGVSPQVQQAQAKLERQRTASKGEHSSPAPVTNAPAPAAENPDAEPVPAKVSRDEGW